RQEGRGSLTQRRAVVLIAGPGPGTLVGAAPPQRGQQLRATHREPVGPAIAQRAERLRGEVCHRLPGEPALPTARLDDENAARREPAPHLVQQAALADSR